MTFATVKRRATGTPETPAQLISRRAMKLEYGDRILWQRGPGWTPEGVTVLAVVTDPGDSRFVIVEFMFNDGKLNGRFSCWAEARFAVLTAGSCTYGDDQCTPAQFRLDRNPWPGDCILCDNHRRDMHRLQTELQPPAPAL